MLRVAWGWGEWVRWLAGVPPSPRPSPPVGARESEGLGEVETPAARGFVEEAPEGEGEEHAGAAEEIKADAPAKGFREPRAEPTTEDGADVNAGLMEGERAGAGAGIVVIAGEGHAGGEVESLSKAFERADGDELPKFRAGAGEGGDAAPEDAAAEDEFFAREAVADESGDGRAGGVN